MLDIYTREISSILSTRRTWDSQTSSHAVAARDMIRDFRAKLKCRAVYSRRRPSDKDKKKPNRTETSGKSRLGALED